MITLNNRPLYIGNVRPVGLFYEEPTPPGPSLPPYTLRLKFIEGETPSFSNGTAVQVSSSPNIWDLTYDNSNWNLLLKDQSKLLEVYEANTSNITNMNSMFYGCTSLTNVPLFDTSNVTDMTSMFRNCTSLTNVPLFDTSNVIYISYMFYNCQLLTSVPLFNTSKVTNISFIFYHCSNLTNVPLFDTSNVTSMRAMCDSCTSLTSVPLFNTSKVTNMKYTFYGCRKVESGALALYQQASSQTNPPSIHAQTFRNCGSNTTTGAAELAQISSDWK